MNLSGGECGLTMNLSVMKLIMAENSRKKDGLALKSHMTQWKCYDVHDCGWTRWRRIWKRILSGIVDGGFLVAARIISQNH